MATTRSILVGSAVIRAASLPTIITLARYFPGTA